MKHREHVGGKVLFTYVKSLATGKAWSSEWGLHFVHSLLHMPAEYDFVHTFKSTNFVVVKGNKNISLISNYIKNMMTIRIHVVRVRVVRWHSVCH